MERRQGGAPPRRPTPPDTPWRVAAMTVLGMLVVMVGLIPVVAGLPPVWPMLVVAAALLGIALIETLRPEPAAGGIEASEQVQI